MVRRPTSAHGGQSFNRLIPNILTLLGLCAGVTAIRFALEASWERAVIAVLVAAVLDGLDGRIARALGATSRFGAELDSLSDLVCFGVAPAVVIYLWSLNEARGLGWALALLYAVCCALRLARFNTNMEESEHKPLWARNYFVGVPAPAAAGLALLPLVLGLQFGADGFNSPLLTGPTLVGVSALMASRIPTFAFKQVKVPGRYVVFVLLAAGAMFAFLISEPWATLGVFGLAYLGSIPYAATVYRRQKREFGMLSPVSGEAGEDEDEDAAD